MNTTFVTTLSTQQLEELIETSVKKAIELRPEKPGELDDELLDTKEAAVLIRYKETSVYGLVKRRKIPYCKVEGKLLFSRKKLLDWISGRTEKSEVV
ncbi:MAG: helix-turn-helix domain-containing protein [Pedobacter sp.]